MTFSADVLKLNPELVVGGVAYQVKSERVLKLTDGFDSQLERDFDIELRARGWTVRPHGWTFHLPGDVNFTPDFIAWSEKDMYIRFYYSVGKRQSSACRSIRGPLVYEVKGSNQAKNARDSRTRFKIAAGLYPCFTFVWVTRDQAGRWIEKVAAVPAGTKEP